MLIYLIYSEVLINVPVTRRVRSNRHRGLHNENSFIFTFQPGVVINLALLIGRAREGRSDRHRNTIPRQVIILLRAPNLWPGMLRYPLNHPSFSLYPCHSFLPRLFFAALLRTFEVKSKISIVFVDLRLKSHQAIDSLCVRHIRATDTDCGYD